MAHLDDDTISAIATPLGRGGIGIVRVSGPLVSQLAIKMCGELPPPRTATTTRFKDSLDNVLDEGIALFFPKPNSFTGEDVLELQGHGGQHVLNSLLRCTLSHGARIARPGEFTERAFLNDKLDLLQAEAVADLIDANSEHAVRSALRTLQGVFSAYVHELVEKITTIRVHVEAAIDFSDEDIDVLGDNAVRSSLEDVLELIRNIMAQASQGALLHEGIAVVIAGEPNAGKSSLLNAFAGTDSAIVTDIAGTTRDLLKEQLNIDGLPVHVTDTAGLRNTEDAVELEGVRRARDAVSKADRILLVVDGSTSTISEESICRNLRLLTDDDSTAQWTAANAHRLCLVINKVDLMEESSPRAGSTTYQEQTLQTFHIAAKHRQGIAAIGNWLKEGCGYESENENAFIARERHLEALRSAKELLDKAACGVSEQSHLELVAEDLRLSQQQLGSITGEFSSDDLLGEIFSSFCVGK